MTRHEIQLGRMILAGFIEDERDEKYLKYNISRDALWPVWERFRDLKPISEVPDIIQHCKYIDRIARSLAYESIEKTFSLLVEAVEWYQKMKGEKA